MRPTSIVSLVWGASTAPVWPSTLILGAKVCIVCTMSCTSLRRWSSATRAWASVLDLIELVAQRGCRDGDVHEQGRALDGQVPRGLARAQERVHLHDSLHELCILGRRERERDGAGTSEVQQAGRTHSVCQLAASDMAEVDPEFTHSHSCLLPLRWPAARRASVLLQVRSGSCEPC